MAYCDYLHCALCDTKAIYDGEINYDYTDAGDIVILCKTCIKTAEIVVRDRKTKQDMDIQHVGFLST